MQPLKVFIGYDPRQPVALQVLSHSILRRSSVPVSITPLVLSQLPIKRRGLTEFTYSRYLVPWLCDYSGQALFLDADMLCLDDIAKVFSFADPYHDIFVVKNKLRFEWPSMILFNNARCGMLTPEFIEDINNKPNKLEFAESIGDIHPEWNHCVGYDEPNPSAKLIHFTAGIPCWPETYGCEFSEQWNKEAYASMSSVSFQDLMGQSVHVNRVSQGMKA